MTRKVHRDRQFEQALCHETTSRIKSMSRTSFKSDWIRTIRFHAKVRRREFTKAQGCWQWTEKLQIIMVTTFAMDRSWAWWVKDRSISTINSLNIITCIAQTLWISEFHTLKHLRLMNRPTTTCRGISKTLTISSSTAKRLSSVNSNNKRTIINIQGWKRKAATFRLADTRRVINQFKHNRKVQVQSRMSRMVPTLHRRLFNKTSNFSTKFKGQVHQAMPALPTDRPNLTENMATLTLNIQLYRHWHSKIHSIKCKMDRKMGKVHRWRHQAARNASQSTKTWLTTTLWRHPTAMSLELLTLRP